MNEQERDEFIDVITTPMTPKEFGAWVAEYEKRTFDTVSFRKFTPEYLELEEAHAPVHKGGNDE